ncbi:glycosyltransferase family 2 protein [Paracoccus sp. J56]|uniref:glycosyltransferase family 2 protein n=1 Tax=Paracoccus sp. J56 TaxID=935850 RepID=UPI000A0B7B90|nr:glycosyltransferase family 2 protein [Paracoccus sp. J56]SMG52019.1 hypothetical protein SAMN02746000_03277 [Paracoccus sp. J56]
MPRRYRRFPDWDGCLPQVPQGITVVRTDQDYGPATKILPAVHEFRGQDCELLLCDDDRRYDPLWTSRFLAARREHPDRVIAGAGAFVPGRREGSLPRAVPRKKGSLCRLLRLATQGLHKPSAWVVSGYAGMFKGYGGAMLRPELRPDCAFDIPKLLWTVDDPWPSGNFARNGVGIWLNALGVIRGKRRIARRDALLRFSWQGKGRGAADAACYDWFRRNRGIWRPAS